MKPQRGEPQVPQSPCAHHLAPVARILLSQQAFERAARLFRALGDEPRLRILHLLLKGPVCVGEVVGALGEKYSTVSQRLRVLRTEGLVTRRRDGSHVYYTLADTHVRELVANALAHADELNGPSQQPSTEDDA